ncbi:MAG: Fic/DOC family N-terminal domain-containing protein [Solirubrobacterales bacterium]
MSRASKARSERAGRFVPASSGDGGYEVFLPSPLPPDPPLRIDADLQRQLDQANQALGRLDGITLLLPDPDQFLYAYIRKEAVLSSQIEGTQSSLSDLLLFEHDAAPGVPVEDVQETSNYLAALNVGLESMREGIPLSIRVLKKAHAALLLGTRGGETGRGEFRRVQNWLGGTSPNTAVYVPPPPNEVPPAMAALEKFLHGDPVTTPVLVRAALAHAQFETIHPFLDGNGRLGRLLVTLLLCAETADGGEQVLRRPLLYLSLHLKTHRDAYYERLQAIRTDGDWEGWLRFFLEGVISVAGLATETTQRIIELIDRDRQRIHTLGRATGSALLVFDQAVREVVLRIPNTAARLPVSEPTVATAIGHLESLGILEEVTGRPRNKLFAYVRYLSIMSEGTEPLGRP